MTESILGEQYYAVSNACLQEIGAIHILWGTADHNLEKAIWNVMGLNKRNGPALTASSDTSGRLTMFGKVLRETLPRKSLYADAAKANKLMRGRQEERNFCAHGDWIAAPIKDKDENLLAKINYVSSHRRLGSIPDAFKAKQMNILNFQEIRKDIEEALLIFRTWTYPEKKALVDKYS